MIAGKKEGDFRLTLSLEGSLSMLGASFQEMTTQDGKTVKTGTLVPGAVELIAELRASWKKLSAALVASESAEAIVGKLGNKSGWRVANETSARVELVYEPKPGYQFYVQFEFYGQRRFPHGTHADLTTGTPTQEVIGKGERFLTLGMRKTF